MLTSILSEHFPGVLLVTYLMLATIFFLILSPRIGKCSVILSFLKMLVFCFYCSQKCLHFFSKRWQWQALHWAYKLVWFVMCVPALVSETTCWSLLCRTALPQSTVCVIFCLWAKLFKGQIQWHWLEVLGYSLISLSHEYLRGIFLKCQPKLESSLLQKMRIAMVWTTFWFNGLLQFTFIHWGARTYKTVQLINFQVGMKGKGGCCYFYFSIPGYKSYPWKQINK